ncbi:MAG: CRTAC1 family protein [Gemmatimonadetes bacterium]|nr:CRTAC1 family protein [Gemmatimonadota bacterium]
MSRRASGGTAPAPGIGLALAISLGAVVVSSCREADRTPPAPSPTTRATTGPAISPEGGAAAWFEDRAASSGIDFVCESGHESAFLFPEIILGGCALFDLEGDGDADLYLVQGGRNLRRPVTPDTPGNRLYRNDGDFRFADVTEGSGASDAGYGVGVAVGDYDDDGDSDLYVTNVGANVLLRNDGDGSFTDVTAVSRTGHPGWGTSASFLDYDADGDLDLFVVNYVQWAVEGEFDCRNAFGALDYCLPTNYGAPEPDVLYRNEGDGTFTDVSEFAGLHTATGNGLGIACADFDGDGRVDVFVANDTMLDQLWINRGDGRFEDEGLLRGCALDENGRAKAGMGVAVADLDGDLDRDLLVVNLEGETDSFYQNDDGFFSDRSAAHGLAGASRGFTRFGVGFMDFDNDGLLDLYQANGRVQLSPEPVTADGYAESNLVQRGLGTGGFETVTPIGGTATPLVATSRAAAFADLDGDGGVDVVVANRDAPPHVLRNVVAGRGHWIGFRVRERSGRDALGAIVTADVAGRTISRDVVSGYSYAAASDPVVHLGLGANERVESVTVRWADGAEERFGDFGAGSVVVLDRGAGRS